MLVLPQNIWFVYEHSQVEHWCCNIYTPKSNTGKHRCHNLDEIVTCLDLHILCLQSLQCRWKISNDYKLTAYYKKYDLKEKRYLDVKVAVSPSIMFHQSKLHCTCRKIQKFVQRMHLVKQTPCHLAWPWAIVNFFPATIDAIPKIFFK